MGVFSKHVDVALGDSGERGGPWLMSGLDDLKGLFQS